MILLSRMLQRLPMQCLDQVRFQVVHRLSGRLYLPSRRVLEQCAMPDDPVSGLADTFCLSDASVRFLKTLSVESFS